jgi:hypothetical protein
MASIMLKRWRDLIGQPKTFGDVNRAGWWICGSESEPIVPKIEEFKRTIDDLKGNLELEQRRAAAAEEKQREACDQLTSSNKN